MFFTAHLFYTSVLPSAPSNSIHRCYPYLGLMKPSVILREQTKEKNTAGAISLALELWWCRWSITYDKTHCRACDTTVQYSVNRPYRPYTLLSMHVLYIKLYIWCLIQFSSHCKLSNNKKYILKGGIHFFLFSKLDIASYIKSLSFHLLCRGHSRIFTINLHTLDGN